MTLFKSHFWFTKRNRIGIFYFVLFVIVLQVLYVCWPFRFVTSSENFQKLSEIRRQIDSLQNGKRNLLYQHKIHANYISDANAYLLGMSVSEIDRMLAFRKENKSFKNLQHFQMITGVSDSVLQLFSKALLFSEKVYHNNRLVATKSCEVKLDINTANEGDFKTLNGIGAVLSHRIVKYRNLLRGFSDINQVEEVWGLSEEVVAELKSCFAVLSRPKINKLNINTATFKEVLSIVYMDYKTTLMVFKYKDSIGKIDSLQELTKIEGFPIKKYERIALYLQTK
ncbi:MAG: helix-hairpin-helix domain-containing protein [Flavicella sp.]